MKSRIVVGLALVLLGAFIVFKGLTYKSEGGAIQVGDFKATVETRRSVPAWVGVVAIVGGLVLAVSGKRARS